MSNKYRALGLMSGTSLDGLDIAQCNFIFSNEKWQYNIERAKTFSYSNIWKNKLTTAENLSGIDFMMLNNEYGRLLGDYCNKFMLDSSESIDFIASHGHTIFHQPEIGLTTQIGNGAFIASQTGITTICDFRTLDVALGGQGAPLVPIGDIFLFSDYNYCLNLGGFSNISFENSYGRIAFDICPVNIVINYLVAERNLLLDYNGNLARSGNINTNLLEELNSLPFYKLTGPKSLGKEWVMANIVPVVNKYSISLEDKLRTYYLHITYQIASVVNRDKNYKMLITGGGANNLFLMELFRELLHVQCVVPEKDIVDFKEAVVFAFLGVLRFRNEVNCLHSVTGAKTDSCGGVVYKMDTPLTRLQVD